MVPSWRWMVAGEESPWYGKVRLFRQPEHDQWQPVLDRIARMLRERCDPAGMRATGSASAEAGNDPAASPATSINKAARWYGPAELAGHKTDALVANAL